MSVDLAKALLRMEDRNAELEDLLRHLLAAIHRDGGHHTEEVGLKRSVKDALGCWARLMEAAEKGMRTNATKAT